MGQDWYEAYARRFGGYRKLWDSRMEGEDGEAAFTAFLRQTVRPHHRVLDVGCGEYLSRVPGNPDYSVPAGLADLPDGCSVPRWWFIWVGENKHGY